MMIQGSESRQIERYVQIIGECKPEEMFHTWCPYPIKRWIIDPHLNPGSVIECFRGEFPVWSLEDKPSPREIAALKVRRAVIGPAIEVVDRSKFPFRIEHVRYCWLVAWDESERRLFHSSANREVIPPHETIWHWRS